MTAQDRTRLVELTESAITGSLDEQSFEELQSHLRDSEVARELYLAHTSVDSMLQEVFADIEETPEELPAPEPVRITPLRRPAILLAVAAIIVTTLFSIFLVPQEPPVTPLSLALENDVRAELSPGADYTILSEANSLDFRSGTGTFFVGDLGKGFSVTLPHGKIIDHGTAFSVSITDSGDAKIETLSGLIEVVDRHNGHFLRAGEGGILTKGGWISDERIQTPPPSPYSELIKESNPVAHWSFTGADGAWMADPDSVRFVPGPRPPSHPLFGDDNTGIFFGGTGSIRIPDRSDSGDYDFQNGDAITLEAWIKVDHLTDNRNVYIVGKGRTQNIGYQAENQNFSLRLRGQDGQACVSFLFRSDPGQTEIKSAADSEQFFHRWTSSIGISDRDRWHHVAVSYRYGQPESIAAYIDGEPLSGEWDMGGPSTNSPVVDDDEIWIGSSMGESTSNTFPGAIDEVAIYRQILSPETIRKHASISHPQK